MSAVVEAHEPSARYLAAAEPAPVRQFDLLAGAPGGLARLRELILTLLAHGRLVPQDQNDEPADRLLARVRIANGQSLVEGRIGRAKPVEPVSEDEVAFGLPQGWVWCRLGDVAWPQAGFAFKSASFNESGRGLPLIRIRDVGSGAQPTTFFSGEYLDEFLVKNGDWLISMDGEFRVRRWHASLALLNQRVTRLIFASPEVSSEFVAASLQRELTSLQGTKAYTTVGHLSGKQIAEAVIALPPTNEQRRIVARVDELMRLCDALDANGRLEAEQHARLLSTLLGALTDSTTPEELPANWRRVADHFDLLLDRPEAVDALEQTILQMAVRGLLVRQDSRDERARTLIERINKARHSAGGRRATGLSPVEAKDEPFPLPTGWEWARFGNVAAISGGVTLGRKGGLAHPVALPYLRVANVQRWRLDLQSVKSITIDASEQSRYQLVQGDLLVTEGGDWDKVGRTAVWRSELPVCLHQNHIFKARGYTPEWDAAWAELYLNSDVARAYFAASAKQTTNLASINMTELKHCVFPMPPAAEQRRIVARVTELRRLCADLRERLTVAKAIQSRLAEALVESIVD